MKSGSSSVSKRPKLTLSKRKIRRGKVSATVAAQLFLVVPCIIGITILLTAHYYLFSFANKPNISSASLSAFPISSWSSSSSWHDALMTTTSAKHDNHSSSIILSHQQTKNYDYNNIINNNNNMDPPAVIAHVVSLIKCSKGDRVTGFLDAAAVLRHSIHQHSIHSSTTTTTTTTNKTKSNPKKKKYSYQMIAIVHEQCQHHIDPLQMLGYQTLIKPSPIHVDEIEEGFLKNHIEMENCCGSAEFIKLYAYTLMEYPITVHWDMDVALFQPMDDLFDSMLFPHDSWQGQQARSRLDLQHPERPLPKRIDAFFTRDITSANPWEQKQGVQGGFLISRPSLSHFQGYLDFIKTGNYTKGRGEGSGWSGLGYGGFQGAMAYQGVVAYFYDQLAPGTAVELDICVWNQVVADVIWRGPIQMQHYGQCREYPRRGDTFDVNRPEYGKCRDCRVLPIEEIKSAHYTACKKPWECQLPHPRVPRNKDHVHRLQELTNVTTCGLLFRKWFDLRHDFEDALERVTGIVPAQRDGSFHPEYFAGSCASRGQYIPMATPRQDFDITQIYGI